jgi:hypothetical protein
MFFFNIISLKIIIIECKMLPVAAVLYLKRNSAELAFTGRNLRNLVAFSYTQFTPQCVKTLQIDETDVNCRPDMHTS